MMMKMVRARKNNPVVVSASCWQLHYNCLCSGKLMLFGDFFCGKASFCSVVVLTVRYGLAYTTEQSWWEYCSIKLYRVAQASRCLTTYWRASRKNFNAFRQETGMFLSPSHLRNRHKLRELTEDGKMRR